MGSNKIKTVNMSETIDDKIDDNKIDTKTKDKKTNKNPQPSTLSPQPSQKKVRSKAYTHARSQVDKTITYPLDKAIELLTKVSNPKHPTVTADINYREENFQTQITFPFSTGKQQIVEIATDKTLEKIEKGNIDFDILLAKPDMMAKIARHAKVLGPRGLMPNPKNQTVTQNPQKRKKELEAGKITIKTEKKAPLLHVQVGSIKNPKELTANLLHLIKTLNPIKITRLTISSTMSPGIKIDITSNSTNV